jgi:GAF domain-containing protein
MLCLPADACAALCHELPRAADLDAALGLIESVRRAQLGDGLLTVNVDAAPDSPPHGDTIELQRLWTSNPGVYPVGGRKRKTMTPWTRQLLRGGELFVGEGDAVLREVFDDHERIASLGLHAVLNVPLLDGGRCFATFNVLGGRPQWLPEERMLVQLLAVLATPWVRRAASAL